MTDDIVTQLREIKWHDAETWVDKMAQAADEIERLRTQVRALETEVTRLERLATNG
jgi:polyhydroxyalkanoate synthesis regulator phasin